MTDPGLDRSETQSSAAEGVFGYPDEVEGGRLVGVDTQGAPVYFDESDEVAFEGVEREGGYESGPTRGEGPLEAVVEAVADAVGWDELVQDTDTDGN